MCAHCGIHAAVRCAHCGSAFVSFETSKLEERDKILQPLSKLIKAYPVETNRTAPHRTAPHRTAPHRTARRLRMQ